MKETPVLGIVVLEIWEFLQIVRAAPDAITDGYPPAWYLVAYRWYVNQVVLEEGVSIMILVYNLSKS